MTPTSVRNQTLAFVIVYIALVGHFAWTTAMPLTLKAVPIRVGDRCYRCERVITDLSLAAEGVGTPEGGVGKFRTVACLLKYVNESNKKIDILVRDSVSGRFIQPQWASFVRTTIDLRTGAEEYVAFQHHGTARMFAARQGTTPMDWETVQASERVHSLAQ